MSTSLTQFSAMTALCRTSDPTPSLTIGAALTEASFEGALTDDRGVGHFFFSTAGSLEGAWSIAAGKLVVDIERVAVRGSRHGGYR